MTRMLVGKTEKLHYVGSKSEGWSGLDAWEESILYDWLGYGRLRCQPMPRRLVLVLFDIKLTRFQRGLIDERGALYFI